MFSKRLSPTPIRIDRRAFVGLALLAFVVFALVRLPVEARSRTSVPFVPAPAVADTAALATPGVDVGTSAANVQVLIADARAAREHHDPRLLARFRRELTALLGATTIAETEATYDQVMANIAAAREHHDPRALAGFQAQLSALCRDGSIGSAIEPCASNAHE